MPTPSLSGAPGVSVIEQLTGPTPAPLKNSPSVAGFAGEHWRGPTRAIQCNSWSDFLKYYGGFLPSPNAQAPSLTLANPYLAYAVFEYFSNGGQTAWISRIASSVTPGVTASTNLQDAAATPQTCLTLTAGLLGIVGNVGTWGNALYVDVVANPVATGHFNLNIYYGGSTTQFLVEQWQDLSMNPTSSRYAVSILNSPVQGSLWVVAAAPTDTNTTNYPAPILGKQFTGGVDTADPSTADRISAMTQGTSAFDTVPGVLNMNMPGETTATVLDAAITYAQTRPQSFLVVDTPSAQTPAGAVSFIGTLSPVSSYAALYYPWLVSPNPASSNLQSTILLPPGGFVLGQMVNIDQTVGVWVAPAGIGTVLNNVVAAERLLATADCATLNNSNVNALRTRPNGSVVIWGTRTMQTGYATKYVPIRRTLNYIESTLAALLEFATFQPNDGLLWTNITAVCNNFLDGLFGQNAFPGNTSSSSYYVICDSTNNTPQSISQGIVNTTVGVALSYPAEFIQLTIAQFQSSGTTVVTTTS